jgi:hypothetical protein
MFSEPERGACGDSSRHKTCDDRKHLWSRSGLLDRVPQAASRARPRPVPLPARCLI